MATINDGKKIWPKAFYDNGGGSFGFTPANKLQTGVIGANLQLGPGGPLLSGSLGQIILGSGANQIILSSSGISGSGIGGPVETFIFTVPDFTIPAATALGVTIGSSSGGIPHGLSFTPSIQGFARDINVTTIVPIVGQDSWRPWNGYIPTVNPVGEPVLGGSWYLSGAYPYSNASFYPNTGGGVDLGAILFQASVDDTSLYIDFAIYSFDNPGGDVVVSLSALAFIITLSANLSGGTVVNATLP